MDLCAKFQVDETQAGDANRHAVWPGIPGMKTIKKRFVHAKLYSPAVQARDSI